MLQAIWWLNKVLDELTLLVLSWAILFCMVKRVRCIWIIIWVNWSTLSWEAMGVGISEDGLKVSETDVAKVKARKFSIIDRTVESGPKWTLGVQSKYKKNKRLRSGPNCLSLQF